MTALTWYIARASGIIGWALVSASVLWGLALSTKIFHKRVRPAWLLDLHRFLGAGAVVFTAIHVVAIVLDSYTDFGLVEVLVPFTGTWHPLAVAWGVIGLYLLAAVEVTSLLRRHLSKRAWRATHFLSFPLFGLSTIHLLTAGSDVSNGWLSWTVVAVAAAVGALTAERFLQTGTTDENGPARRVRTRVTDVRDEGSHPVDRVPGRVDDGISVRAGGRST